MGKSHPSEDAFLLLVPVLPRGVCTSHFKARLLTLGLKKEQGQEQAGPGLAGARTPVPEGG